MAGAAAAQATTHLTMLACALLSAWLSFCSASIEMACESAPVLFRLCSSASRSSNSRCWLYCCVAYLASAALSRRESSWMAKGSGAGDFRQAMERRRSLSPPPELRGSSSWAQRVALSMPVCVCSGGWPLGAAASQGTLSTLVGLELLYPSAPDLALVAGRVWQKLLDRLHLPR